MAELKDSGARRDFGTGAVRDVADGKGRCDLLPLGVIGEAENDIILTFIEDYIRNGRVKSLWRAIVKFAEEKYENTPTAMLEVAKQYEDGARKYSDRNWEKGMPVHFYIDSGVRHYLKFRRGDTDEPHDRAFVWNMLGAIWTHENKPELIDLPFASKDKPGTGKPGTDTSESGIPTTDNPHQFTEEEAQDLFGQEEPESGKWDKISSPKLKKLVCKASENDCDNCPISSRKNGKDAFCQQYERLYPDDFRRIAIEYLEAHE